MNDDIKVIRDFLDKNQNCQLYEDRKGHCTLFYKTDIIAVGTYKEIADFIRKSTRK